MLLLLIFGVLFLIVFAVIALTTRPSREKRVLQQRLDTLLMSSRREGSPAGSHPVLRGVPANQQPSAILRLGKLPFVPALELLVFQGTGRRRVAPTLVHILVCSVIGGGLMEFSLQMAPVATLCAILCGTLPLLRLRFLRDRRLNAFNKALPDSIDMCSRALRAGHSLAAAIGIASEQAPEPARAEFAEIFRKQNFGLPLRDALLETLERFPSADFRVFVTGILVQKDTGGNLTEIFDRIVLVMRERLRLEGEIRIHTAQGRMTAWILTLLPPTLFFTINVLNPGYSRPMFADSIGRMLFYVGIVSLLCGGMSVRRIVHGIEV